MDLSRYGVAPTFSEGVTIILYQTAVLIVDVRLEILNPLSQKDRYWSNDLIIRSLVMGIFDEYMGIWTFCTVVDKAVWTQKSMNESFLIAR